MVLVVVVLAGVVVVEDVVLVDVDGGGFVAGVVDVVVGGATGRVVGGLGVQ